MAEPFYYAGYPGWHGQRYSDARALPHWNNTGMRVRPPCHPPLQHRLQPMPRPVGIIRPMKIRGAILHEPRTRFVVDELTPEDPQPGEVLVRGGASRVCHSDHPLVSGAT